MRGLIKVCFQAKHLKHQIYSELNLRNNNVFLFFKNDLVLQKLLRNIKDTFDERKDPLGLKVHV